jgi:hypothetical protein
MSVVYDEPISNPRVVYDEEPLTKTDTRAIYDEEPQVVYNEECETEKKKPLGEMSKDEFYNEFRSQMDGMSNQEVIQRLIDGMVTSIDFPNSNTSLTPDQVSSMGNQLQKRGITMDTLMNNMKASDKSRLSKAMKRPKKELGSEDYGVALLNRNIEISSSDQKQLANYIRVNIADPACLSFIPRTGKMKGMKLVCWYSKNQTEKFNKEWCAISGMKLSSPLIVTCKGFQISATKIKSYGKSKSVKT